MFIIVVAIIVACVLLAAAVAALASFMGAGTGTFLGYVSAYAAKVGLLSYSTYVFGIVSCAVGAWTSNDPVTPYELYQRDNGVTAPTQDELNQYMIVSAENASPVAQQANVESTPTQSGISLGSVGIIGLAWYTLQKGNTVNVRN
jgi:flagellar basal body-associated protein FliL